MEGGRTWEKKGVIKEEKFRVRNKVLYYFHYQIILVISPRNILFIFNDIEYYLSSSLYSLKLAIESAQTRKIRGF